MSNAQQQTTTAPAAPPAAAKDEPKATPAPGSDPVETDEIAAALAAMESGEPAADAPADDKAEPKKEAKDEDEFKPGDKESEKEPDGPAGKGWAAVRKREQKFQKRQQDFDAKVKQWETRAAEIDQRVQALQQREAEIQADPLAFLNKLGLSFDDLARRYLNDGKASPQEEAKRAGSKQEDALRAQEERMARIEAHIQQREAEASLAGYKADVKTALADDELELLRAWPDAADEVMDFADKWAQRTKEVLTPRDAALKLQSVLRKQITDLSSHQVVRNLLAGASGAPKQEVGGRSQVPRGSGESPKTLTNHLAATPAAEPNLGPLGDEEELQAALRLVTG